MPSTPQIERLAAEIGENIYIDVAKWHLYLAEAHLHTTLAEKVYSLIEDDDLSTASVTKVLQNIKVKLGGDRLELPLVDLIPTAVQTTLINLLRDYSL